MSIRSFGTLFAAVLLVTAASTQTAMARTPPPQPTRTPIPAGTNPCNNPDITQSIESGMQTAINNALANMQGKTQSNTVAKSTSFNVPHLCGPFGTCVGGKTYSASAGRTTTTTGATDISTTIGLTQTSCSVNSDNNFTTSGSIQIAFNWLSAINTNIDFYIKGFLGTDINTSLNVSINGLTVTVPGTFTITSTSLSTATITAASVNNCVSNASSVNATLGGTNEPTVSSSIQSRINNEGPAICTKINNTLSTKVVGMTISI